MELVPGTEIDNRYVVEARIGQGGMAEVFCVRHLHLDTQHALKVLTVGGRSLQRRLMQEGRVQAALRHPNIVAVTDVVMVEGAPGLVMEFVAGPPLDELLNNVEPELDQVDSLVVGILDGVAAAHELNLIHRDLKPANVMVAIRGDRLIPKVADFGLVKLVADDGDGFASKTRSGTAMGTPAYMAPEQIRDAKTVDHRADVWSLGAILYELVAGRRAFDASDVLALMVAVAGNERDPIQEVVPDLPERMVNAIEGALTLDRDERIPSVTALRETWLKGATLSVRSPWDASTVQLATSMGSGVEDTSAFIKRSFRSNEPLPRKKKGATGGTAVPQAPGTRSAPTATPGPEAGGTMPTRVPQPGQTEVRTAVDAHGTFVLESEAPAADPTTGALTMGPQLQSVETMSPPDISTLSPDEEVVATTQPSAASNLLRTGVVVLLLAGMLAVVMVGMAALGVLGGISLGGGGTADPTPAAPAVVEPGAPASAEPEPEPEPEVATPSPSPVAPVPAGPASDRPPPKPDPAPPAEGTASEAPGEDEVAPEEPGAPPDPPEGVADEEATPMVLIDPKTDVTVKLRDSNGKMVDLDALGPGTYTVIAFFKDLEPKESGTVTLSTGGTVAIKCMRAQQRCSIK